MATAPQCLSIRRPGDACHGPGQDKGDPRNGPSCGKVSVRYCRYKSIYVLLDHAIRRYT
jgi:hypothetical protein